MSQKPTLSPTVTEGLRMGGVGLAWWLLRR